MVEPEKSLPEFLNGYVVDDRIWLFSRGQDGTLRRRQVPAEYSSFLRSSDVTEQIDRMLRRSAHVARFKKEGDWLRISWRGYDVRKAVCGSKGWFAEQHVQTFEGDVSPVRRWFADSGATIAKPRHCYLDLEWDSRVPMRKAFEGEARILCWTVEGEDGSFVQGLLAEDSDAAERVLLNDLWAALEPYDQIRSWFGDGADFPVMRRRSSLLRPRVKDPRRWLYLDQMEVYERMNVAAESGAEKESLALKKVAKVQLGDEEESEKFNARGTWKAWLEDPDELLAYNARDTTRQRKIEEKTGFCAVLFELCKIATIFPDTYGTHPTAQVDGYVLRKGIERGEHFATRVHSFGEQKEEEQYKGAIVIPPTRKGIVKNVHVADFSGMYPSIILSFNMSPETKRPNTPVNGPVPDGVARTPTTRIGFSLDPIGIIPLALAEILRLKKFWNDAKATFAPGTAEWIDADRKATAYKVASNAFYGVLGSAFSRFFDKHIAEGTTQTGVYLITETVNAGKARGVATIYGDTDSAMATDVSEDEFRAFVEWCNTELYPQLLTACGVKDSQVKLAYEKMFERIIFSAKANGDAVKKRYVGRYAHYKGKRATKDSKPEVRGLEWRRGDASQFARAMQYDAIRLLMGYDVGEGERPKDAAKFAKEALRGYGAGEPCEDPAELRKLVEAWRSKILEGPLARDDVKLAVGLSKPLSEYAGKTRQDGSAATQPAHVRVAHMLASRGLELGEGAKIEYFIVDGSTKPATVAPAIDYRGTCDRHHLWEKMVFPPTHRLLVGAFPNENWEQYETTRPLTEKQAERARKRLEREEEGPELPRAPKEAPTGLPGAKKSRRKPAPVAQRSLFDGGGPAMPPPQTVKRLTVSDGPPVASSAGPVKIAVGPEHDEVVAKTIREVLEEHPGSRRVLFERAGIVDDELSRIVVGVRVSGDDAMWDAIESVLA